MCSGILLSKYKELAQCWFNGGPASQMVVQHSVTVASLHTAAKAYIDIGETIGVACDMHLY